MSPKAQTTTSNNSSTNQGTKEAPNPMNLYIANHPETTEAKAYSDILSLAQEVKAGGSPDLLRLALGNSAARRTAMLEIAADFPEMRQGVLRPFWRACLNAHNAENAPAPAAHAPYRFHYASAPMALQAHDEGYVKTVLETWDERPDGTHEFCTQEVWSGDRHTRHTTEIKVDGESRPDLAIHNPYAGSLHYTPAHGAKPESRAMMPRPHRDYDKQEWNEHFANYLANATGPIQRRLQQLAWLAYTGHKIDISAPAETEHARLIAGAIANTAVAGIPDHIAPDSSTGSVHSMFLGEHEAAEYQDNLPPLYLEWDWRKFKTARNGEIVYEVEPDTYIRRGTDHLTVRKHGLKPTFKGKHIKAGKKIDATSGEEYEAEQWVNYSDNFTPSLYDMRDAIAHLKDARTEYTLRHPIGQSWPIARLNKAGKIVPDNSARNWAYEHGYRTWDQEPVAEIWKYTQYDHFTKRPYNAISVQDLRTRWLYNGRRNPEPDGRMREHDLERADDFNIGENQEWNDATVIAQGAGYLTDEDINGMAAAELALIEDTFGAIVEGEDEDGNPVWMGYTTQRDQWYKTVDAAITAMYKKSQPKGDQRPPSLSTTDAEVLAWNKSLKAGTITGAELIQIANARGYRDCIRYKPNEDGTWNAYAHAATAQMLRWTPIKIVSHDYPLTIEQQKKYNNGRSYRPTPPTPPKPLAPIGKPKQQRINSDIGGWIYLNLFIGFKPAKTSKRPAKPYLPAGTVWGNQDDQANEQAATRKAASIRGPHENLSERAFRARVRKAIRHAK